MSCNTTEENQPDFHFDPVFHIDRLRTETLGKRVKSTLLFFYKQLRFRKSIMDMGPNIGNF